jgi:hypothetical protein
MNYRLRQGRFVFLAYLGFAYVAILIESQLAASFVRADRSGGSK